MKILTSFISSLILLISMSAFSANQKTFSISQLVDQYYAQKDVQKLFSTPSNNGNHGNHGGCYPDARGCLDTACEKLGTFACDDRDEVTNISKACRGNWDGTCLRSACEKMGSFGCDDISEVQAIARACVGNYGSDCLDSVCSKLGTFGCDDQDEVEEVLRSCSGD